MLGLVKNTFAINIVKRIKIFGRKEFYRCPGSVT